MSPATGLSPHDQRVRFLALSSGELASALSCHPEYKLLSVCTVPQVPSSSMAYSTFSWPSLLKHLRQMLVSNTKMEEGIDWQVRPPGGSARTGSPAGSGFNRSLANLLVLRGKDVYSAETGGFEDPALYTSWLSPEEAFSLWKSPVPFNKYEKCATLVSNSQALLRPLDDMVGKAWNMFASRAYLHQYMKFGISEEDFLDCFTSIEQVVSSYSQLH
uniref:Tubulin, delta 1 n=1 Tax=Gasterosteus aculeatus TaxID=69293 RepID=G3NVC9_GASAC